MFDFFKSMFAESGAADKFAYERQQLGSIVRYIDNCYEVPYENRNVDRGFDNRLLNAWLEVPPIVRQAFVSMCEQGQVEVYVCVNNTWKDVNAANNKGACAVDYDESTGTHRLFIKPKHFQQYSILHELVHIFDRDRSGARPISESHEMQQAMDQLEAESEDNVVVQVREYVHQGHYRPQLFKSETAAYAAGSPFSERNSHVRNYVLAKMEERAQQILNQADTGYGGRY